MIKLIKNLKVNKIEFFLILGFFISAYSFSIVISSTYRHYSEVSEKNRFNKDYKNVVIRSDKEIKVSEIIDNLEDMGIRNISTYPMTINFESGNDFFINKVMGVSKGFNIKKYARVEGKNFNDDELGSNNEIVIIGEGLKKHTFELDDKLYLKIVDKNYEVVGIIKDSSFFKYSSIVPIRALSLIEKEYNQFNQLIHKDNDIKLNNDELNVSVSDIPQESVIRYLFKQAPNLKQDMYGLLLGIINLVLFSFFFAKSIKRKVAIMKVLGAKNIHVYKELLFKSIKISFIGIIFALIASKLTVVLMSKAFPNLYAPIDKYNIVITITLVFIISILVSLVIMFNVIRFKLLKDIR